jgi:hypothetical protein
MRDLLRTGEDALVVALIMLLGSLVMWIGVPIAWLWIASQITGATGSLGAGLGCAMFGVPVSLALMIRLLTWLSNLHRSLRVARGQEDMGHLLLEGVLVVSAGVATIGFAVWFFGFSGASPLPLHGGP